ncbi:MAG: hypoxanthine phosphoribosyltransferase [Alphaproteobacteria bacterium]
MNRITKTLFDEAQIAERVEALAGEIARKLTGEFVIVGLLKGCFVFVADLARALSRQGAEPRIEFMRLSSYGLEKQSAGEVHLLGDIPTDIAGRDILLVDDIVDTGRSIAYAKALLEQREVGTLLTCALIDKPSRREVDVAADFVGFAIEDLFIAGYGIDYAERYRHLPSIGVAD